jgi:hypothetical protein
MVCSGLAVSFGTTLDLPGGITAADEDLVRFTGAVFAMVLEALGIRRTSARGPS